MDRTGRVSDFGRSTATQVSGRSGRRGTVQGHGSIRCESGEAAASREQTLEQQSSGEQGGGKHFTQEQAKAHYYAKQQDKGQYYAEQRFGEQHRSGSQTAEKRKAAAEKSQEFWKAYTEHQKEKEKESQTINTILDDMRKKEDAFKKTMDPKNKKNLYDATMDLMLVEQAEKTAALKAIQTRLLFKMRSVKNSGAKASEIRAAISKIKKVIGKVKGKIKNLRKEDQLEKKRKRAEEQKRKEKERALRLELERRKKVRKVKERNDVEESKMGMGANYGGSTDPTPAEIAAMTYGSTGEAAAPSVEAGGTVDVAVADMGAVADAGAMDVSL